MAKPADRILYGSPGADGRTPYWRTPTLWAAAAGKPVASLAIAGLGILDEVVWFGGPSDVQPTVRRIAERVRDIVDADLDYPIITTRSGDVLDGAHRIARAHLQGLTHIAAVVLDDWPPPDGFMEVGLKDHGKEGTAMAKPGVTYLNPPSSPPPAGMYSHVARMTPGELAFIAGQVAVDAKGNPVGAGDLAAQVEQVFANLGGILKHLGADFECVVQFTTYLTSAESIPVWMSARSALFPKLFPGGKYPPNTLLVIDRLVRPELLLEVEAIARVPG